MRLVAILILRILLPPENKVVKTEHIEGCETRHHCHPCAPEPMTGEHGRQHLIFREKSGERRNTGYGETSDKECPMCNRHVFAQTAHRRIVVAVDSVDERTRSEEEERLEHGVGEEVEHRGHISETGIVDTLKRLIVGTAERHHHKRDLRDCGECEHPLYVDLRAGHYRSVECGDGADYGDESQRIGHYAVEREETGYKIHTGHHHSSGMDQRRNRCRTLHGVGKPDVERHHGRFTHTSDKYQNHRPCQH